MAHEPFCACCASPAPPTPILVFNRPGLSTIPYRIGTFATFRETMLEAIAGEPALSKLTSRAETDYAVTLIELFAALGDVLTFYNERIANELYLRTARERDSVLRLARLLGYRLRPGLAAQTMLEFTLDAGAETHIRKSLKVMSVPGQDERPQIFETTEQIVAHADINDLPAFAPPGFVNALRAGSTGGALIGRPDPLAIGERLILFGLRAIEEKSVSALVERADGEALTFTPAVQQAGWSPEVAHVARLHGRLRFFGHNAPAKANVYIPADPPATLWPRWESQAVNAFFGSADTVYPLDGRHTDIATGAALLIDAGPGTAPRLRTAAVTKAEDLPASLGLSEDTVTHLHLRQTIEDRPAIAILPAGHIIVGVSGTGAALIMPGTGTPRSWVYAGYETLSSPITAVGTAAGRADIFARDQHGGLRQRVLIIGPTLWIDHGGILTTEPRAVARPGGQVDVFVRGLDFGLWTLDASSGAPGTWVPLGGVLTSTPVPVAVGGDLVVFVRGLDRALWSRRLSGGTWSPWTSLGGVLATAPAAASRAGGIDVVTLDDSGQLIHRRFVAGAWSDWAPLGGALEGEPAAVTSVPDRLDVVAKGQDGGLWHIARIGDSWSGWAAVGGALGSAPVATRDGVGLHVYARSGDGTLVYRALLGTGWTGATNLGDGIGAVPDRRKTAIYRLSSTPVRFRAYDYPAAATGGQVALHLTPDQRAGALGGLAQLTRRRRILLRSGSRNHVATITAATLRPALPGAPADHLFVDFAPSLPAAFPNARLIGNVVAGSHGETQPDEPLGHGEAAKALQQFRLSRPNLTYLQQPDRLDGTAELAVRANGELWHEVPSLFGRRRTERVFTARQSGTGETMLTFGDGITGARLPSGAQNVVARYRTQLGLEGRMKPGQLSIALERPVGLSAVTNPLPADGAADPEGRDDARAAAPRSVRTFGRAISLADFEYVATSSGVAQRAFVTWVWRHLERAVHISAAGPGGSKLSAASLATLAAALDTVRDVNRPLFLANLVRVPVIVSARILRDLNHDADAVLAAARANLLALLAFETTPLGTAVFLSAIYGALQDTTGVAAVDIDTFQLKGHAGLTATERGTRAVTAAPVQPHIRIFPARPTPAPGLIDRFARAGFEGPTPPPVLAAEQAFVEAPASDIRLTIVEAL